MRYFFLFLSLLCFNMRSIHGAIVTEDDFCSIEKKIGEAFIKCDDLMSLTQQVNMLSSELQALRTASNGDIRGDDLRSLTQQVNMLGSELQALRTASNGYIKGEDLRNLTQQVNMLGSEVQVLRTASNGFIKDDLISISQQLKALSSEVQALRTGCFLGYILIMSMYYLKR